ncbi:MAG: spore germination protein [Actinobacteria bacterium]|nr:spore germination protein [Actinomycetota bacterium]
MLNGLTVLFVDGCNECLVMETRGYEKRNVDTPKTETVVKGSQEAFNENLRTNITLIRRIIKNEKLVTDILPVGKTNNANCAILYIDGIANPKVVKEVKFRINNIDSGFIMGSGMLEQFIEDSPWMLMPQVINTERPDRAASFLMSGQVVIIVDGTPIAMAVPVSFWGLFHTSEDSELRWQYGTFLRLVRFIGLLLAASLPGLYLALELYHPEAIPTSLLAVIEKTRENVPFPALLEILMMEVSFELIREGGLRIPGVIGQTLGINGALILGQAAVAAGLVSPILIIIVAITGLGSFTIPNYQLGLAIRILRFFYIIAGSLAGFLGISVALTITGALACATKSFGVPYFSPVAPVTRKSHDIIIEYPVFSQKIRPDYLNTPDRKRQRDNPRGWVKKHLKEKDGS